MSCHLEVPAYKVEVSDIRDAQEEKSVDGECKWTLTLHSKDLMSRFMSSSSPLFNQGQDPKTNHKHPSFPSKELELNLALIWIQGTVVSTTAAPEQLEIPDASSVLCISDATGEALIYDFHTLPGGDHSDIVKGAYVGVIGQIWFNKPTVVIKGAKIMYLNNNPSIKTMWADEIGMDRAYLLGLIEPGFSGE